MNIEDKLRVIEAAGYTVHDNGTGTGWYALLPGEREFHHEDDSHNYVGFFSARDDLAKELYADVADEVMGFHNMPDTEWDLLSPAQIAVLAGEMKSARTFSRMKP